MPICSQSFVRNVFLIGSAAAKRRGLLTRIGAQARRAGKNTYAAVRVRASFAVKIVLIATLVGCAGQPEEEALRATFQS
ncbi:MAG: hypothetical protein CVV17_03255, partial [Gammaproteobacteria bacterium HGW-Gammaproteobacteria-7]